MPTLNFPRFVRLRGQSAVWSREAPPPASDRSTAGPPRLAVVLAALLPVVATAVGAAERGTVRLDPLDARVAVPRVEYRSALAGYRPAGELKLGDWREANDTVTRIGGWRAYTREAQAAEPLAPAASPAAGAGGSVRSRQP